MIVSAVFINNLLEAVTSFRARSRRPLMAFFCRSYGPTAEHGLRAANWWGGELSPVYYDKQKVLIDRPRLRGKDNKVLYRPFELFVTPEG